MHFAHVRINDHITRLTIGNELKEENDEGL